MSGQSTVDVSGVSCLWPLTHVPHGECWKTLVACILRFVAKQQVLLGHSRRAVMRLGQQVFPGASVLDLELTVREGEGEGLECCLAFSQDLFDASTARRMLDNFMVCLCLRT